MNFKDMGVQSNLTILCNGQEVMDTVNKILIGLDENEISQTEYY